VVIPFLNFGHPVDPGRGTGGDGLVATWNLRHRSVVHRTKICSLGNAKRFATASMMFT
jgi:hypothetical protein